MPAGWTPQLDGAKATAAFAVLEGELHARLLPHQRAGVRWMLERELDLSPRVVRCGVLADDMGMGKTYQVAGLVRAHQCPTLVVTTNATMGAWRDALSQVAGRSPRVLFAAGGQECGDLAPVQSPRDLVVTSYSALLAMAAPRRQAKADPLRSVLCRLWGRIVLDEAHQIRNRRSLTFKTVMKLRATHRWAVTGTPINNRESDLESTAEWVGVPLAGSHDLQRHYILRRVAPLGDARPTAAAPPVAPPPGLDTRIVRLAFRHQHERALYAHLEDVARRVGGAASVDCPSLAQPRSTLAMEAILRLRQACVHPDLYLEGVRKKRLYKPHGTAQEDEFRLASGARSTKLEYVVARVREMCAEDGGVKVLVFCEWIREMELLALALPELRCLRFSGSLSTMEKEACLRRFAAPDGPRVLLVQIRTGGTGVNLQAASRVIVTSPNWNPCNELQAMSRAHRHGQMRPVLCERVVMEGTVEERCMDLQRSKLSQLDDVLDRTLSGAAHPSGDSRMMTARMGFAAGAEGP